MVKIEVEVSEDLAYIIQNWEKWNGEDPTFVEDAFIDAFNVWGDQTIKEVAENIRECLKTQQNQEVGGKVS